MIACASCGLEGSPFCPHHHASFTEADRDWARANKAFCDWLHRGIELSRVKDDDVLVGEGGWGRAA